MPGAALDPASDLIVIGINQITARPDLRERLFGIEPDAEPFLAGLRAAGVGEGLALATCERVELVTIETEADSVARLLGVLADTIGIEAAALDDQVYRRHGVEALSHLFAVAASVESQTVGEPQILGQVKEGHRRAAAAGLVGPALESVLQATFAAAKRVRTETPLARQPVSIATSALLVARDVHGDLARRGALLIGLGEMGEFMAGELQAAGVRDLVVVHASPARAEAAARRLGCNFRPWEDLPDALAAADIVVSALGAGRFGVTARAAEAALKRRRREPIYFIDAAVPRDIEAAVDDLDGAFVYDLEDLERVALSGKAAREAALVAAKAILEEEVAGFLKQRAERGAAPSVAALRAHFESIRGEVLTGGKLDADEATRRLINRLLHEPSTVLRAAAAGDERPQDPSRLEAALRRLFRLDGRSGGKDGGRRGGPADEEDT